MKTPITHRWLTALAFVIFSSLALLAQEQNRIVIIQKIQNDDGTETVIKKSISTDEDLDEVLEAFGELKETKLEINGENIRLFLDADERILQLHNPNLVFPEAPHAKKAFLGIYPATNPDGPGVLIESVIAHTAASAAGLRNGDVLLAIDGKELAKSSSLSAILAQYQPQDQVSITFLRNGETCTTQVTLGTRANHAQPGFQRDPCQVFIGVTVGGSNADGRGTAISGIIENTPAEAAGLQPGDIILALDDMETNSHEALLRERNKHQPGDWFTLSILREGQITDVEAQFQSCDQMNQKTNSPTAQEPNIPTPPDIDYTLDLTDYAAYPNPSYGEVHIRFQAEAKPTMIRISDASGKVIFQEDRPDFDGYYARPVDLSGAQPGLLLLTIIQEDRLVTKKLVLLARA